MLQTAELLKKVRRLEIFTRRRVDDVIGGAYRSVFKGRGIEFAEVGTYYYRVVEVNAGKTINGVTYDSTVYNFDVIWK